MTQAIPAFTGPSFYDDLLGPVLFAPYADELARRLPTNFGGTVLELACGTGQVTRRLRSRIAPWGSRVATDLSESMLEYARGQLANLHGIHGQAADVMALPFEPGAFDAVVCGFGFMFAPDRQDALHEARRVLAHGGLLLFTVWDRIETNAHSLVNAQVVEALLPGDPELSFRTPYEMHDTAHLRELLGCAGLHPVRIDTVRIPLADVDPRKLATGQIRGTPRGELIAKRGISLAAVIDQVADALEAAGGNPYQGSAQALLVEAQPA